MTTSLNAGFNWRLDGRTIQIFRARGVDFGMYWTTNLFGGELMEETSEVGVMPMIRDMIARNVSEGKGDKIAMVLVAPREAVLLYLEGVITLDQLRNSTQTVDSVIDVHNVDFDGRTLDVQILRDAVFRIGTADSYGIPIF